MCNGNDGCVCNDSRDSPFSFRTNRVQHNRAGLCRRKLAAIRYFQGAYPYGMNHVPWINATYHNLMVTSGRLGPRSHQRAKRSLPLKIRLCFACIDDFFVTLMHVMQASRYPLNRGLLKNGDVKSDLCFASASSTAADNYGRIRPECGERKSSLGVGEVREERITLTNTGYILYPLLQSRLPCQGSFKDNTSLGPWSHLWILFNTADGYECSGALPGKDLSCTKGFQIRIYQTPVMEARNGFSGFTRCVVRTRVRSVKLILFPVKFRMS